MGRWLTLVAVGIAFGVASTEAEAAATRAEYLTQLAAACEAGNQEAAAVRKKLDSPKLIIKVGTLPAMARLVEIGHGTVDAMSAVQPPPGDEALAAEYVASLRALPTIGQQTVSLFRLYFKEKARAEPREKRVSRLGAKLYAQDNKLFKAYSRNSRAEYALGTTQSCGVVLASGL